MTPETEQNALQLRQFIVNATREVAYESPDHLIPFGTMRNNSTHARFNKKLNELYGMENSFWLLDLGCSGGGFVKSCLDEGHMAVGIEGSDYSQKLKRAEWRTIPGNLFTADITAPFQVSGEFPGGKRGILFDVITTWEVMEHIHERDIASVAENVKKHLRPGGLWIMSVALCDDFHKGVNLHQTVKPKPWWVEKIESSGLKCVDAYVHYFNTQFLRGPKDTCRPGFHLIATNNPTLTPKIPKEPLSHRIFDRWLGSRPQRLLRFAIYGY
ncbi:MAG TPA: class I SAM-dependent methyltransferase [Verrucomicrobiae bacterium]|jgi:SAM-dependent methyltransferase